MAAQVRQRSLTRVAVCLVAAAAAMSECLVQVSGLPRNTLTLDTHSLHLVHRTGKVKVRWGVSVPEGVEGKPCGEGDSCLDFGVAKVVVAAEDHCHRVSWTSPGGGLHELKDCVVLQGHWYGGGQQKQQPWPVEKEPRQETPFVTTSMSQTSPGYGAVSEAYWVSSQGVALRVMEDTPLFLTVPDLDGDSTVDELCLTARHELPYVAAPNASLNLTYFLCSGDDVRKVHEATFPKFFSLPEATVDPVMVQHPIWSTWAEYFTDIDETRVLNFARGVADHGFNNSQVEIDDDWETCYGEAVFDPKRFPNPRHLVDQLHSEGFRVTLWTHPFINSNCPVFTFADQKGYLVKDSLGNTQLTDWWNSKHAGIVDFTNADAVAWWTKRLRDLQKQTGIDSFKFDAGEASYLPANYTLQADERLWPNIYTFKYVEALAKFGNMVETRMGSGSQRFPVFVRMLDKESTWGSNSGLKSLVPSLLHFGLLGYPFVLPDIIGGDIYTQRPSKELFIRWAQASAFMPSLQFSIPPWDYDEETTELCREVTRLHARYTPLLLSLAKEATVSVVPIARPTWWLCPTLEECLTADQQFLVGDDVLVVPVVTPNASTLDVVVPPGEWQQEGTGPAIKGPTTITLTNITLDTIVYFTKTETTS